MSPIDDELRTALSSRTDTVGLSPDFFSGVERRARSMRRQRVAATVAGSALTVSALGLGGPMLASSLTSTAPGPSLATQAPAVVEDRYALDPADPWPYRGDRAVLGGDDGGAYAREVETRYPELTDGQWSFAPLYGTADEPSGSDALVFLVRAADGRALWGAARSSESGAEVADLRELVPGQSALTVGLPGADAPRLLVVAAPSPELVLEYAAAGGSWAAMAGREDGVALTAREGDPLTDRFRVLDPSGDVVTEGRAAPQVDLSEPAGPQEPEGPGTGTPLDVDPAPYRLDLDDPWAYRGPLELTQHPDLASQDERLFVAGGTGRADGSWSQRPLLAVEDEATGMSVLLVLHRRGDLAIVTTTWQTQDEAPRQSEQQVRDGQLLVQTVLPDAGPAGVLLALASPRAGAVETDVARTGPAGATPGLLVAELPADPPAGEVFLYAEGDGLLLHAEPARRS
jgi:hypothetical protein